MGLKQAGFDEITGIDIEPQPEYPFEFRCGDALDLPIHYLKEFDFIWASPPCQAYTWAAKRWDNEYPTLIEDTRLMLDGVIFTPPYVIENVMEAPIKRDLVLCGEMFGLGVIRHRAFELSGFWVMEPEHSPHKGRVKDGDYVTVAGHGGDGRASLKSWQDAMGIDWITDKKMLAQAVPPAYAKYIGEAFLRGRVVSRPQ